MRKIIAAIVLLVFAVLLRDKFRYSNFEIVFDLLSVGAFVYLIAAVIGFVRKGANSITTQQPATKKSFFKKYWLPLFLIIAVVVYFSKEWLEK